MIPRTCKELVRRFLPRARKGHRILQGPLKGRIICTSWHDYPGAILGTTEGPLLHWFIENVAAGETWLDVGAHYGYTALALARLVGPAGRTIAFEPVLSTAACVSSTRELNKLAWLQVIPFGLGNSGDVATKLLPLVRGMADSTIQSRVWMEPILVASFDYLASGLLGGDQNIDGVKIDVQGMEFEVLFGMTQMLRACHPKLIIEFHAGVNRSEILDLLQSCGYRTNGKSIEGGESASGSVYADDRSYVFFPDTDFEPVPMRSDSAFEIVNHCDSEILEQSSPVR